MVTTDLTALRNRGRLFHLGGTEVHVRGDVVYVQLESIGAGLLDGLGILSPAAAEDPFRLAITGMRTACLAWAMCLRYSSARGETPSAPGSR